MIPLRSYLCFLPNCLIDDIVILDNLFLDGEREILHSSFLLLEVYITETTIEKNLARIELEHETELCIVDHVVPSQVQQRVVEIR